MKRYLFIPYFVLALIISGLKNIEVADKYNFAWGIGEDKQTTNNLIFFFGVDLIIFFLTLSICNLAKHYPKQNQGPDAKKHESIIKVFSIISYGALSLAAGKIIDEFTRPYGYHKYEVAYDITVLIFTFIAILQSTHKKT